MASTLEIFLRWEVAALTLAVFIGASLEGDQREQRVATQTSAGRVSFGCEILFLPGTNTNEAEK